MSYKARSKTGTGICWFLFLCYIGALVYFTFFAEEYGRAGTGRFQYNLVLFQEITRYIRYRAILGTDVVILNLAGNIVAFAPFGFLLPLLSVKERRMIMILLLSFELSLVIEVVQLFTGRGSFDVDDLLLNTLGGMLGYGCYCLFARMSREQGRGRKK